MAGYTLAIQSAPVRRGTYSLNLSGLATSTSVPSVTGTYLGDSNKTYTFTVDSGGTIGSSTTITVTYTDGTNEGVVNLGTAAEYAAADVVPGPDGVSLAFAAGTLVATETFTMSCVAVNALPYDHAIVEGDAYPTDIIIGSGSLSNLDIGYATFDGTESVVERAIMDTVAVTLDYVEETQRKKLRHMMTSRERLCFGEDYDETTVFLWRGGTADERSTGLLPLIGPHPTYSRGSVGAYRDKWTGLWRVAASGAPRYYDGPNGVGKSFDFSQGASNLVATFHPKSGSVLWTSLLGTPTISFDSGVSGCLHPDDTGWTSTFRSGTTRLEMASGDWCKFPTVTSGFTGGDILCYQVWLKGRGIVNLIARSGVGSPVGTSTTSNGHTLTGEWQRIAWTHTTGGTHNQTDFFIEAAEDSVCWASATQIELGYVPTALVQRDGGSGAARSADAISWSVPIPKDFGTFSFWIYWPGDAEANYYRLFECASGAGLWAIRYSGANDRLEFHTSSSGALVSSGADLSADTWYHVEVTWQRGNAGEMARAIYVNGTSTASDSTTSWDKNWSETFDFGRSGGVGAQGQHSIRIAEVRMDREAKSAAQIADAYARYTDEIWLANVIQAQGRHYRIRNYTEARFSEARQDLVRLDCSLAEVGREAHALTVAK